MFKCPPGEHRLGVKGQDEIQAGSQEPWVPHGWILPVRGLRCPGEDIFLWSEHAQFVRSFVCFVIVLP